MNQQETPVGDRFQTVEFPSADGLMMTADYYPSVQERGLMLLCHRSHANRAEYRETAPRLVERGYSCLAIDQRSGMKVWGATNETSQRARRLGRATGYLDARVDIESAIRYSFGLNRENPIILVGSSYSASLALLCSIGNPMVRAVTAFSPGEFLKGHSVREECGNLKKPVFVTSSRTEIAETASLVHDIGRDFPTHHRPSIDGFHGSKML